VTGAAGFIGAALCRALMSRGHGVVGLTRTAAPPMPGVELRAIGDIGPHTDWRPLLAGIEIVVHLANRAHRRAFDPENDTEPAIAAALAAASAQAGVRRLVHMSSVLAMGEETPLGRPFQAADPPAPRTAYGRAKLAIEQRLAAAASEGGLDCVILRPPLVYGPGVKGNFRALLRLAASGLPLPLGGIDNRRSLIFLDNLIEATILACLRPEAARRVLLLRDARDLSISELVTRLGEGLGRRGRLFALPAPLLRLSQRIPGVGPAMRRLAGSLQVADDETRLLLDWRPATSPEEGLALTARAWRRLDADRRARVFAGQSRRRLR
jgi:nucleoside-diphosphate-sugar epimerase